MPKQPGMPDPKSSYSPIQDTGYSGGLTRDQRGVMGETASTETAKRMNAGYGTDTYDLDYGMPVDNKPGGIYQDSKGMWHAPTSEDQSINTGYSGQKDMQDALDIYGSIDYYQPEADPMAGSQVQTGGGQETTDTSSWRNRIYADRAANRATRGGPVGGGAYGGPVYDYPELNIGQFEYGATLDLPGYEPPEYDKGEERAIREEFIQSMKGDLSEQAQSAILGSASVDNPQARGKIIEAALEGFGDALKGITLEGSQEGRKGAQAKYGRDVGVYNTQFEVASQEELARYDRALQEDMMNWEVAMEKEVTGYNQQMAGWNAMPGDVRRKSYEDYQSKQKLDKYYE